MIMPTIGGIAGIGCNGNVQWALKVQDGPYPSIYTTNNTLDDGTGNMTVSGNIIANGNITTSNTNLTIGLGSTSKNVVMTFGAGQDGLTFNQGIIQNPYNTGNIRVTAGSGAGYAVLCSPTSYVYLQASIGVNVVAPGTTATYKPIAASAFNVNSLESAKTNITPWKVSALDLISKSVIYEYNLKSELKDGIKKVRHGFVIGRETPVEIIDHKGDAIDDYGLGALNTKAIQELKNENDILKEELLEVKRQLDDIMNRLGL